MARKFNIMYFGLPKERIRLVHFPRPKKDGLAGMIQGDAFNSNIGILVDDRADYAGLFNTSDNIPFVHMLPETFYGIKSGNNAARTALFHELGHFINGDHIKFANESDYDEERARQIRNGSIMECEKISDDFAVKYLGAEYVAIGLEEILNRKDYFLDSEDPDEDQEWYELAQKELRLRIERIRNL